jgi:hypothetical protein
MKPNMSEEFLTAKVKEYVNWPESSSMLLI